MPDLIGHLIAKYLREILRLGYLFFVHKSDGFLDKVKTMDGVAEVCFFVCVVCKLLVINKLDDCGRVKNPDLMCLSS